MVRQENNQEQELLVLQEKEKRFREGGPSRKWIAIIIAAVVVIAAVFIVLKIVPGAQTQDPNTFAKGVIVLGRDLSGMDYAAGAEAVKEAATEKVQEQEVAYEIGGQQYTISGAQAGMVIDCTQAVQDAFAYGKNGSAPAEGAGMTFDCVVSTDAEMIRNEVMKNIPNDGEAASGEALEKTSDEETKSTGYEVKGQSANGNPAVDVDRLAEGIATEMAVFGAGPVVAEETEAGQDAQPIEALGSYETQIEHPELDSAYNIWMASDLLNTTEIKPGETWSMKDALGTLAEEDGWKQANELIDGKIQKIPGGGLNHLASTVYAAALASEMEIEQHESRPWPADYIEPGLDADIFSEGADLRLKNTSDASVYLVIECNAEAKTLTVSFLGQPFEDGLKREVSSETVTETNDKGGVTAEVTLQKGSRSEKLFEVEYQASAA